MLFLPPFRWTLKSGHNGLMNTLPEDLDCHWWTDNLVGGLQDSWSKFFFGYSLQNENSSSFINMALPVGRSKGHAEDYRWTKWRNMEPDESRWRASNSETLQTRVDVESVLPVRGIYRKWWSVCRKGMENEDLLVLVPLCFNIKVVNGLSSHYNNLTNICIKFIFIPVTPPWPPWYVVELYLHLNLH